MKEILGQNRLGLIAQIQTAATDGKDTLVKRAESLKDVVDGLLIDDAPMGQVTIDGLAVGALVEKVGLTRILKINARDHNRIALQARVAGAVALGMGNILCASGAHPQVGASPQSKRVYDLDPVQMVHLFQSITKEQKFATGQATPAEWQLSVGVEVTPFGEPAELYQMDVDKKIAAGAEFFVTAPVFDVDRFKDWIAQVDTAKVAVIATISPVHANIHLQGGQVPEQIQQRVDKAADAQAENIQLMGEILQALKQVEGLKGINFALPGQEDAIAQLIAQAGLK